MSGMRLTLVGEHRAVDTRQSRYSTAIEPAIITVSNER